MADPFIYTDPNTPVTYGLDENGLAFAEVHFSESDFERFEQQTSDQNLDPFEIVRQQQSKAVKAYRIREDAAREQLRVQALIAPILAALDGDNDQVSAAIYRHCQRGEALAKALK